MLLHKLRYLYLLCPIDSLGDTALRCNINSHANIFTHYIVQYFNVYLPSIFTECLYFSLKKIPGGVQLGFFLSINADLNKAIKFKNTCLRIFFFSICSNGVASPFPHSYIQNYLKSRFEAELEIFVMY